MKCASFLLSRQARLFSIWPDSFEQGARHRPTRRFLEYKDSHRSLFFHFLFHFSFTFFNDSFAFSRFAKIDDRLFCYLTASLAFADHRQSSCLNLSMKHFAHESFSSKSFDCIFYFRHFLINLLNLVYDWSQWYKRTLLFVVSYFVIDAAIQFENDFYLNHVETSHFSILSLWIFRSRSFFVSHCFITAQLIRDSMISLMKNFSLRWAFHSKKIVWFEIARFTINERHASSHACLIVRIRSLRSFFCCLTAQLTLVVLQFLHETFYFWSFLRDYMIAFFIVVIFWLTQSRLRLKSTIYANPFIRRFIFYRLRCNSVRRWFLFSIILKRFVVRFCWSESSCLNRFV